MPQLAGADQVGERPHRFLQRRGMVFLVEIHDVDGLDAEALEAGFGGALDVPARGADAVGADAGGVGELGGQHPPVPVRADGAADDFLALAAIVGVGGVDEIDALVAGGIGDAA